MNPATGYLTVPATAARLDLPVDAVEKLIADGNLECHLIDEQRLIPAASVRRYQTNPSLAPSKGGTP